MDRPRKLDKDGYWRVKVFRYEREQLTCYPSGWALEHRVVMEQQLGRKLRKGETVYRHNEDRQDNRPENLYVTESRSKGRYGPLAGAWRGARWSTADGYVMMADRGRKIFEHRYVMEQLLGRPLLPHETVHHKNGRRDDNRPENLELWIGRHPRGASEKHCPTCTCFEL